MQRVKNCPVVAVAKSNTSPWMGVNKFEQDQRENVISLYLDASLSPEPKRKKKQVNLENNT